MVKISHAASFTINQEERNECKALWSSSSGLVFVTKDHVVSKMLAYEVVLAPSPIVFSFDLGTSFPPPPKKRRNNNNKTACYVRAGYGKARGKDLR